MLYGCLSAVFVFFGAAFGIFWLNDRLPAYGFFAAFFAVLGVVSALTGLVAVYLRERAEAREKFERLYAERNELLRQSVRLQEEQLRLERMKGVPPSSAPNGTPPKASGQGTVKPPSATPYEATIRRNLVERLQRVRHLRPSAQLEETPSEREASEVSAPDASKVTIRRGERHVYVKPVRPKPETPESAAHKERHERLIERLRRQRRD